MKMKENAKIASATLPDFTESISHSPNCTAAKVPGRIKSRQRTYLDYDFLKIPFIRGLLGNYVICSALIYFNHFLLFTREKPAVLFKY